MKRLAPILFLVGACGGGHLGSDYGKRVRAASAAQTDGKGDTVRFDAEDSKRALSAQRDPGGTSKGDGGGGPIVVPSLGGGGGGSSSSSKSGGTSNPIQMEGVR